MKDVLSDEEVSHPLNEDLLQEAGSIKAERKVLSERLEKLDQNQGTVSASVYRKVRADYHDKLQKKKNDLLALKKDLQKEYTLLLEKKKLIETHIALHREKIEESKLRHSLEEYTQEQYEEFSRKEGEEVVRLETALQKINEGLEQHRKLSEGEDSLEGEEGLEISEVDTQHTAKIVVGESRVEPAVPESPDSSSKKIAEVHVLENGKAIQMVPVVKTIQIGRSPANDIVLKEAKVSRKHAEIQTVGGKYVLLDLESSNGTYIGGKKITEYTLKPGDEIVIGNTKMVFKV